jgi:hypothetical protein
VDLYRVIVYLDEKLSIHNIYISLPYKLVSVAKKLAMCMERLSFVVRGVGNGT